MLVPRELQETSLPEAGVVLQAQENHLAQEPSLLDGAPGSAWLSGKCSVRADLHSHAENTPAASARNIPAAPKRLLQCERLSKKSCEEKQTVHSSAKPSTQDSTSKPVIPSISTWTTEIPLWYLTVWQVAE